MATFVIGFLTFSSYAYIKLGSSKAEEHYTTTL